MACASLAWLTFSKAQAHAGCMLHTDSMKCPNCGTISEWDTLRCVCGYDAERRSKAACKPVDKASTPVEPVEVRYAPARRVGRSVVGTAAQTVAAIGILAFAGCALLMLFVGGIIVTILGGGSGNDAFLSPFAMVFGVPVVCGILLIGGVWFALHRLSNYKPPKIP